MPWCPNCRTEYRAGFQVCSDCMTLLVESLDEGPEKKKLCIFLNPKICKYVLDYLKYNKINADFGFEGNTYTLSVPKDQFRIATQEVAALVKNEEDLYSEMNIDDSLFIGSKKEFEYRTNLEQLAAAGNEEARAQLQLSLNGAAFELFTPSINPNTKLNDEAITEDEDESEAEGEYSSEYELTPAKEEEEAKKQAASLKAPTTIYTSRREVAKETMSSGIMFIVFGIAGIVFMVLNSLKILTLYSPGFSMYALYVLFAVLFIGGIWSVKSTKKLDQEADEEDEFVKQLTKWCDERISLPFLMQADNPEETDEFNYILRNAYFRKAVLTEFPDIDRNFLDSFAEDYYNEHFEN